MSTRDYIMKLAMLKPGDLGLLRTYSLQGINCSPEAFDLFAGLWWPLRSENQRAPRREVAWLIAKLYAYCPVPQSDDAPFASQLSICQPHVSPDKERFQRRFDHLLVQPLNKIEVHIRWALGVIVSNCNGVDWVSMTDDFSIWEREETRLKWSSQFIRKNKY